MIEEKDKDTIIGWLQDLLEGHSKELTAKQDAKIKELTDNHNLSLDQLKVEVQKILTPEVKPPTVPPVEEFEEVIVGDPFDGLFDGIFGEKEKRLKQVSK